MSILISVSGDLTMAAARQSLFEALGEFEDLYAVQHTRGVTLYINPIDEFGERLVVRNELGGVVSRITKKGPYHPAADEYHI